MVTLRPFSPEAESWVYDTLEKDGIRLHFVEGYSVKDDKVTALFERRYSDVETNSLIINDVENFINKTEDDSVWAARLLLSKKLEVSLYIILQKEGFEPIKVMEVKSVMDGKIKLEERFVFDTCEDFAKWLGELKGIPVSKKFITPGRLAGLDECLRMYNVPWPGNLDGFLLNQDKNDIIAIFEFSRTIKYPIKEHDIRKYFTKDVNRWMAFNILNNQLKTEMYIILWHSDERIVKVIKVKSITKDGLKYEYDKLVKDIELTAFFVENILKP